MQSVRNRRRRQASLAVVLAAAIAVPPLPAKAISLFAEHVVEVQFSTPDGKPLANAEVHVFAPGNPPRVVTTGRTDKDGKFSFEADQDGMWSAEVHQGGEVARVTVRVGGESKGRREIPSYWLIGGAGLMLALAIAFRVLRARSRRPH